MENPAETPRQIRSRQIKQNILNAAIELITQNCYEKYSKENGAKLNGDFIENILAIYDVYMQFCMKQGVQFIKNFYTPSNKSLDISNPDTIEKLPMGKKLLAELKRVKENGYIIPTIDISQVVIDMCIIEKGLLFEWGLTNGKFELQKNIRRIFIYLLKYIVSEKYKQNFMRD